MSSVCYEHIVVIEDDSSAGNVIGSTLQDYGFRCNSERKCSTAIQRLESTRPDAIIVDLDLADGNALELISVLRRLTQIPVIVVSGASTEAEKIAALDNGGDDYLEKPFLPEELVARVRANLCLFGSDQLEKPVDRPGDNSDVSLCSMERLFLALLIKHQGATVPEEEVIAALWGSGKATSADLHSLVLKLNRKLQLLGQPLFVLNDRGVGYHVFALGQHFARSPDLMRRPRSNGHA